MSLFDRMLRLDRRWIFLFVGVAVAVPLFLHVDLKIDVTPEARGIYDAVEALPPGSKVILACDYDPGTAAETAADDGDLPQARLRPRPAGHHHRALAAGAAAGRPGASPRRCGEPAIAALQPQYGVDYINLGYQSGNEVVIQRMGSDIPAIFPRDYRGPPDRPVPDHGGGAGPHRDRLRLQRLGRLIPGRCSGCSSPGDRFHVPHRLRLDRRAGAADLPLLARSSSPDCSAE